MEKLSCFAWLSDSLCITLIPLLKIYCLFIYLFQLQKYNNVIFVCLNKDCSCYEELFIWVLVLYMVV